MSDTILVQSETTNRIKNLPIVVQDVKMMNNVLGKNPYGIKGKTARGKPATVKTGVIPLPKNILEHNQIETLCVGVMFVNKFSLLITVSERFIMERSVG